MLPFHRSIIFHLCSSTQTNNTYLLLLLILFPSSLYLKPRCHFQLIRSRMQIYRFNAISCVDNWCSHFSFIFVWFVISGSIFYFIWVSPLSPCLSVFYERIEIKKYIYSQQLTKALLSFPIQYLNIYLQFLSSAR